MIMALQGPIRFDLRFSALWNDSVPLDSALGSGRFHSIRYGSVRMLTAVGSIRFDLVIETAPHGWREAARFGRRLTPAIQAVTRFARERRTKVV